MCAIAKKTKHRNEETEIKAWRQFCFQNNKKKPTTITTTLNKQGQGKCIL